MSAVKIAYDLVESIGKGLLEGTLERVGGLVRDSTLKQVVGWLREAPGVTEPVLSPLLAITSAGTLNLAISTMGFAVVMRRLGRIEHQLRRAQEALSTIDYKIDLSFYANFRAALDLANSVVTMSNPETRKASLLQAVNRFLEAERHYTPLADVEIHNRSQIASEYLSTLSLAYVIAARCYLELEELETAEHHLKEGLMTLRPRYERHISDLLTSNPAAYLHPLLRKQVDLRRLTRLYQWMIPGTDLTTVFEMQRDNLFSFTQNQGEWIRSLPQAIKPTNADYNRREPKPAWKRLMGGAQDWKPASWLGPQITELLPRLAEAIDTMEMMIEDDRRFQTYVSEVRLISELGMSFREWREIPLEADSADAPAGIVYLTVN